MQAKILIVSPAWVGDIVLAQVLLQSLKRQHPDNMIDLLAPPWAMELLQRMPEVNQVHALSIGHGQLRLKQRWQIGRRLAKENYTQAYILPNSWKSALIPFFANIPKRTAWLGECRWGLVNDVRYLDKEKLPLMVERFLALGPQKEGGKPLLEVNNKNLTKALEKFNLSPIHPILVLCPGAEYGPAKRWPAKYYAEIAKNKLALGWQVWLLGGIKDQVIGAEIQAYSHHRCVDLTGQTTLGEAVDLLSLAKVVVTNDSGLMHIAAALQRPLVAIYGSSSPRFTPPLSDNSNIVSLHLSCSPCFKRICPLQHLKCLNDLQPSQVLDAMTEFG